MNSELDLLLTAYLDDELDDESRRAVESAVRFNAIEADQLAAMSRVRDLVGSLPRPSLGIDVSRGVLAAISQDRRWRRNRVLMVGSILSGLAAACILVLVLSRGEAPRDRVPALPTALVVARRLPPRPATLTLAKATRPIRPAAILNPPGSAIPEAVLVAETKEREDRSTLRTLLRQGDARQINVVIDEFGPASLGAVDSVVENSHRIQRKHAKVQVVQGVEIDPRRPGKACVYVLVMDEHEYARFRANLDERFPNATSEPGPAPKDALLALSSVGSVEIFTTGQSVGVLKPPPPDAINGIATRVLPRDKQDERLIHPRGHNVDPKDLQQPKGNQPEIPPQGIRPKGGVVAQRNGDSHPSVYLVWVSPRDRHRR